MNVETILVVLGCLILFGLYKIYKKVSDFYDSFDSWYGDWQKEHPQWHPHN